MASKSTSASFESIRDAASSGHVEKPAKPTTIPYVDTLSRIWIADPVPGWLPTFAPVPGSVRWISSCWLRAAG